MLDVRVNIFHAAASSGRIGTTQKPKSLASRVGGVKNPVFNPSPGLLTSGQRTSARDSNGAKAPLGPISPTVFLSHFFAGPARNKLIILPFPFHILGSLLVHSVPVVILNLFFPVFTRSPLVVFRGTCP